MSLFKPLVIFPFLTFASPFIAWNKIPLIFSSWIIRLWTKRAHQSTNFETFVCFNESSPNFSCQFWNHKVKIYSNFTSQFSVMKDNSSAFLAQIFILWAKSSFQTFECLGENSPDSLCHVWNYQVSFSLNFASLFSVMRDNSSVLF